MRHIHLIILVISFLLLAGCDEDFSPLVSAEVTDLGSGTVRPHHKTWKLNEAQLKQLELWLSEHKSEGNVLFVTTPSPSIMILVTHANGSRSSFGLFSASGNWEHLVEVGSSGSSRFKNISSTEREELLQLVQEMPDINLAPSFKP